MTSLRLPPMRPGSRILGLGAYRPERIVSNAEVCELIDSSDEWIQERSGIVERRFAAEDESVVDMATEAAGKALAHSGVAAAAIDTVIVATVTHPFQTPSAAAEVADRLSTGGAAAYDVGAACAGFSYALAQADALVRCGTAEHVLVVGVEKLTDFVDPTDRSVAFIFADGAGAVVVGPSDEPRIGPVVWGSDGSRLDAITMTQSWVEHRADPATWPSLTMQGQAVFRWAVREMAAVAQRTLEVSGVTPEQLDVFVPHQANMRITDAMIKALRLPPSVVVARDIATMGNTSAASIPLALDRLLAEGTATSGDTALFIGFGAGLTYAAQVVVLP